MSLERILAVGLGGGLGAILRYTASSWVYGRFPGSFPMGTLAVNAVGCFLIGGLWAFLDASEGTSEGARLFVGVGFLGGLTTFSTFGQETVALAENGETKLACLSVALNVAVGLFAVLTGRATARLFF